MSEKEITSRDKEWLNFLKDCENKIWLRAAKIVEGYEHENHTLTEPLDCSHCRELGEINSLY